MKTAIRQVLRTCSVGDKTLPTEVGTALQIKQENLVARDFHRLLFLIWEQGTKTNVHSKKMVFMKLKRHLHKLTAHRTQSKVKEINRGSLIWEGPVAKAKLIINRAKRVAQREEKNQIQSWPPSSMICLFLSSSVNSLRSTARSESMPTG